MIHWKRNQSVKIYYEMSSKRYVLHTGSGTAHALEQWQIKWLPNKSERKRERLSSSFIYSNMDPSESLIDPQAEVKKLQDLVKKLEKQNEVLRGRQKLQLESLQNGEVEQGKLSTIHNNNIIENNDKIKKKSISCLDDIDVLDVENLAIKEDEDSWWVHGCCQIIWKINFYIGTVYCVRRATLFVFAKISDFSAQG